MNFKTPIKLPSKQKIFVLPSVLLIASFLVFYFLILPSIAKIKEIRSEILNQKIELKNNIKQSQNINKLNEELKNIKPKMEKLDQIFINKNRELDFITLIESIADKHALEQKISLNPGQDNPEEIYKTSPINISLKGNYSNIIKYLKDIESIKYYLNVKSISISSDGSQKDYNIIGETDTEKNVSAIINADIYWKNN